MGNILIEKLNPHPKNEYYFTDIEGEKYEEVKRSIVADGIRDPIVITTSYTIISGHQRLRIATDLCYLEVPVDIKDVDEWQAEYLLIAYNTERRGEAEKDPIKKGRIAQFLKDYWGIKNNGNNKKFDGLIVHQKTMKDVSEAISLDERSTRRLLKLNKLIPQIQTFVSTGKLGIHAAEQLAYLTEEEQTILFEERGDSIGDMTVEETKKLRKEIEDLREENKKLKDENANLNAKVKDLESKEYEVVEKIVEKITEVSVDNTDYIKVGKLEQQIEKDKQDKIKDQEKMKKLEKEVGEYKDHVIKLKNRVDDYKKTNANEELSPQSKLFMSRHLEIAEDCHKIIEKIGLMTILPPSDLPFYMVENYKKLFYETGNLLIQSYEKLSNQIQIIDVQ